MGAAAGVRTPHLHLVAARPAVAEAAGVLVSASGRHRRTRGGRLRAESAEAAAELEALRLLLPQLPQPTTPPMAPLLLAPPPRSLLPAPPLPPVWCPEPSGCFSPPPRPHLRPLPSPPPPCSSTVPELITAEAAVTPPPLSPSPMEVVAPSPHPSIPSGGARPRQVFNGAFTSPPRE
ncbi:uncharacterized protein LOC126263407 [Schistocerca nitens]|uniref:uncharacterized protein LOC126263407 n=1 Tax=Schistocerca nitens TaxID=7011 RepID=UPI002118B963|nr:uncharacterized protein LOC126263407 [Schistocerca nitens]